MSGIFRKTEEQLRQLESIEALSETVISSLSPYGDCVSLGDLEELAASFRARAEDFSRKGRKFTLAVAGQVKAGKSSFLDTLLFGGKRLLPRASTPKTSALTCIEYSKTNKAVVEYYTPDEWAGLERLAASPLDTPQARAAREILSLAVDQGTPIRRCFAKPKETVAFESVQDIDGWLNNYVGEDGLYTPLVKSVTLRMALPELRGLSVVDTPGLNDPVLSRVEKTRGLIEVCDAVFFLSHSSFFLDRNDLALLAGLLPHKGVASLTVVGSQFDSVLVDALADYGDLGEALAEVRIALRRHAAKAVDGAVAAMRASRTPPQVLEVVERCRRPVFVSALVEDLAAKLSAGEALNEQEQLVLDNLGGPSGELLGEIANFGEVRREFTDLVKAKDKILAARAESFGVVAKTDLRRHLEELRRQTEKKEEQHKAVMAESTARQKSINAEIGEARRQIEQVFDEYLAPLEKELENAYFYLLELEKDGSRLEERTDYEIRSAVKLVSASRVFAPWTWGKKDKIYLSEKRPYQYMDPEDVNRKLAALSEAADRFIESLVARFCDTAGLESRLIEVAAGLVVKIPLDGAELREQIQSATRYLAWTRPQAIPQLPRLPKDLDKRITDSYEKKRLREAAAAGVTELLDFYRKRLDAFGTHLRAEAKRAAQELGDSLCAELISRRAQLAGQTAQAAQSAARHAEAIEIMGKFLLQ